MEDLRFQENSIGKCPTKVNQVEAAASGVGAHGGIRSIPTQKFRQNIGVVLITSWLTFGIFILLACITPAVADVYNVTFDYNAFAGVLSPSDGWYAITLNGLNAIFTNESGGAVEVYANGAPVPFSSVINTTPLPVTTAINLIAFRWDPLGLFNVVLGRSDGTIVTATGSEYYSTFEGTYISVYTLVDFPASTVSITFENQGTPGFSSFAFQSVVYTVVGTNCAADFAAVPSACGGPVFEPAGNAIPFPTSSPSSFSPRM
jgi:hypothetical protein